MKLLELILLALLLAGIISTFILRPSGFRRLFSVCAAALAVLCVLALGIRLAMLPAFLLAAILLTSSAAALKKNKKRAPLVARLAGMAACTLIYAAACVMLFLMPVIDLPKPSGSYLVGTMLLDFVEPSRSNVFTGEVSDERIALQIWYPATASEEYPRAFWMDRTTAKLLASSMALPDILGQLSLVKTNSFLNTPLSDKQERYPVIVFSGGLGSIMSQNTVQMEELASHGYVVCAVSHPGDDYASVFSDGTLVASDGLLAKAQQTETEKAYEETLKLIPDTQSPEFQKTFLKQFDRITEAIHVWSGDLIAAADYLEKLNLDDSTMWKGRLDMEKLGVFGHSFGGAAAGEACLRDSRFKAFANLDGTPFGDTSHNLLSQPFLVMTTGKAGENTLQTGGYAQGQTNYTVIGVNGALHMNFMDFNTVLPRLVPYS